MAQDTLLLTNMHSSITGSLEGYMGNNEASDGHTPSRREALEYTLQSLMSITPLEMDTSLKLWEEQFIQQWAAEDVEWRLCLTWRLRNTLFRAPSLSEEALCWGIRLVKDILGQLRDMGEGEGLSTLGEKGPDIMEEIIRAALRSTPGAQLPRKVILTACEVGEMMFFHIQNSRLKSRAMEVVRIFGESSELKFSKDCLPHVLGRPWANSRGYYFSIFSEQGFPGQYNLSLSYR